MSLPDFSVAKDGQVISVIKGSDRIQTVDKAIDSLGGIERFVKPGDVVVIKPNVAFTNGAGAGRDDKPEPRCGGCEALLYEGAGENGLCDG